MTTDDIIKLARIAGAHDNGVEVRFVVPLYLVRFAALLRDRMISEGWRQCAQGQRTSQHCGMVEQARQEEREACLDCIRPNATPMEMAAAIRARGQQRPEPTYPSDPIWREQKRLEMEAWARNKLARHGIPFPGEENGRDPV